jgi:hypothetical protein
MSDRLPKQLRWRQALEQGLFGTWDLDLPHELVHYSPDWKARLGFPRIHTPDSVGFWRWRVHPDDLEPMLDAQRAHFAGRSATYESRFRLRSNGSGYRTMLSRGRVVARDDTGRATRVVGTMVDLTQRTMSAAAHGLATEDGQHPIEAHRAPFHTLLAVDAAHPLVVQVDDLLDRALRDASSACAPAETAQTSPARPNP